LTVDGFFEVGEFQQSGECVDCGKPDQPCVLARCKAGTFAGMTCAKCLFKECRKRTQIKRQPPKAALFDDKETA
jgi:hypothetical protein